MSREEKGMISREELAMMAVKVNSPDEAWNIHMGIWKIYRTSDSEGEIRDAETGEVIRTIPLRPPTGYLDDYMQAMIPQEIRDKTLDWFRRCIADMPEKDNVGYSTHDGEEGDYYTYDPDKIDAWKKKWFSQFEEEEP